MPKWGQPVHRVKNAAQVYKRCEHERRDDGDIIKGVGKDGINESCQGKYYRG